MIEPSEPNYTLIESEKHIGYKRNVVFSLVLGWGVFIGIVVTLWSIDVVPDADFFTVSFDESKPPKLLGIPLQSSAQFYGMGGWFFLNSFATTWTIAVIGPIFNTIMITNEKETIYSNWTLFFILSIYEILKAVRYFVSLLGVLSNAYWFSMTSGGWLFGALLTRYLYLNQTTVRWMKHNFTVEHKEVKDLKDRIQRLEQLLNITPIETRLPNSLYRNRTVLKYS